MSQKCTEPDALRIAEQLDAVPETGADPDLIQESAAELRRQHTEIERLNNAMRYEQDRSGRIGTHGPGCHLWGYRHHECLEREYREMLDVLTEIVQLWDHHCYAHGDGRPTPLHVKACEAIAKAEVKV